MWTVTAEGPVDEIYEKLKERFDDKYVEKEPHEYTRKSARGQQLITKQRHVVNAETDQRSLQFRLALKSAQQQVSYLDGKVKVTIKGDEKSVSTKVEEV